jgi:glycosyltransferase involved in cell wall biosynthesis
MKKLRIFVPSSARLLTDRQGHGEGLIAWQLLSGLAGRGHEIVVCARIADLGAEPPFELILTGLASRLQSLEPLVYMRKVARICRSLGGAERFDLAHWLFPTGPADTLFAPPSGLPLVVGPQSAEWPTRISPRPRRLGDAVRALARPAFSRARRQTEAATSVFMGTTTLALTGKPAARARLVPRGIDPSRFAATEPNGAPRILFVGKLERSKGVRELVEAFARTRDSVAGAQLVLAGEGPERGWIEQRARELGLNGSLELLGPVEHSRIADLLEETSLLCLPSHGEPFGMAALEAMAAGRAVVGTNAGGLGELVDPVHGGRLVAPFDTNALAAALVELLTDRDMLVELGRWNRDRVEREFSLERVLDRIEDAYQEALG